MTRSGVPPTEMPSQFLIGVSAAQFSDAVPALDSTTGSGSRAQMAMVCGRTIPRPGIETILPVLALVTSNGPNSLFVQVRR